MSTTAVLQSHALFVGRLKVAADLQAMEIRAATPFSDGDAPASGWFLEMEGGGWFGLFLEDNTWFLFVGEAVVPAKSVLAVDLQEDPKGKGTAVFTLPDGLLEAAYEVEQAIPYDPTPFIDDEDLDFGLYLKNRVLDPEKLDRIAAVRREEEENPTTEPDPGQWIRDFLGQLLRSRR